MVVETKNYTTQSAEETVELGALLANRLKPGDAVGLIGDLGAGKTHFVHGVARGLGVKGYVSSPSFTIINIYKGSHCPLFHIDLYRLDDHTELAELGLEEYIYADGISVIEWVEKAPEYLEDMRFVVRITHVSDTERLIEIEERE
ncbi:MAG: tRNA (adenosine(37)-N6)-threonylcarbamoyltransferase complex ATPase subunit type 1 TsaE [Proteobacteria bacterium]|nr:tRNA (adenosine(37)-N6)-threonylcarbamoyltransferase complex ATPase subunit type 1 TsaE [Pseudomonadota bacterium]